MSFHLYYYRAIIRSVYDGDTCKADIDLGLNTWIRNETLRLARIDTPELRGAEYDDGISARDFVRSRILDKEVILQTVKDKTGKYGRYLAEIWLIESDGSLTNLNDLLLQQGMAEPYGS